MTTTHTPGQVAYEAFAVYLRSIHYEGCEIPSYAEVADRLKLAWEAAAQAVQEDALRPARAIVQHWYEFGPEDGFDEAVHALDVWLKRLRG